MANNDAPMQVEGRLFGVMPDDFVPLQNEDEIESKKKCCACSAKFIVCVVIGVILILIALTGLWLWVSYLTISVTPCTHPDALLPDRVPPNMEDKVLVNPSLFGSPVAQGLAWDGTSLFFSGTDFVASTVKEGKAYKIVESVDPAIPPMLSDQDYWHVGDITFFDNTLLLPIQDHDLSKPRVLLVDPSTLLSISSALVPGMKSFPWAAVRQDAGQPAVLYSSEYMNANEITRHEYPSMTEMPSIPLPETVKGAQGGEFDAAGILHLSADKPDAHGCNMYEVDVSDSEHPLRAAYTLASLLGPAGFMEVEGLVFTDAALLVSYNLWYFLKGIITIAPPPSP